MEIYEITGFQTGVSKDGVNYLQPSDSFQNIEDGFIFRQVLQSRRGIKQFSTGKLGATSTAPTIVDGTRVMGIFEHVIDYQVTELLAITTKALYKYNTGTDTFDQIPMAGSAPAGGFAIAANDFYVSGTTYPFPDGSSRFVFTGAGMADTYLYDGTNVKLFTNVVDNIAYQAPASGALTNAHYVFWFGERLVLLNPTINAGSNPQGFLYSAIRTSGGNGDKFNTSGAGLLSADTSEYINGAIILGDVLSVKFTRSDWILEKTRDNFNPFFIQKIPSVIGTDAGFSMVTWENESISIGKTGIISANGRNQYRIDKKIPAFIQDQFDSANINLTYGGFDRTNNQLLFAYKSIDSTDTTQDKVLINNYAENTWAVYDLRFSCFGQTDKGIDLTWDDIDETNDPSWGSWETTEEIWNRIGIEETIQKTLAGDDNGFIWLLNQDADDYVNAFVSVILGATTTINIGDHSFEVGDEVIVQGAVGADDAFDEINNFDPALPYASYTPWIVQSITASEIVIDFDSSQAGAYVSDGTVSKTIDFSAEMVPFNPFRAQGRKCYISHIEFLLDTNAGFLNVDLFDSEEVSSGPDNEGAFKENVLIQPTQVRKKREWISMSVNHEAEFFTLKMNQASPALQVLLTSIRIHAKPGGLTSG